jgi:ferredoxin
MSSAIRKLLSTEVLEVHTEVCKNYGNQQIVCSTCVDQCEEGAITFDHGTPLIHDTQCVDCGACVSACFVHAIDHLRKPYAKVKDDMKNYPKAYISCDQVEHYNLGVKVPCLLYLDFPLLSQYVISEEVVHIYVGQCQSCHKVSVEKVIDYLETQQEQLLDLGLHVELKKVHLFPKDKDGQMVNPVSRRDLFKGFSLTSIRELILSPTKKQEPTEIETEILTRRERMCFKKNILNEHLQNEENQKLRFSEYYPTIEINQRCNGCNVCERICPTNALNWIAEGEESHLMFTTSACVSCEKCLACPQDALLLVNNSEVFLTEKRLITMTISSCTQCGDLFKTTNPNETHCFVCEANSMKDPMRFFRAN